jgi:hypothetical protein
LRDTANDRIRFVPNLNYNDSVPAGITFRAWDATDGRASGTTGVNPGAGGGETAFSTASETASITVNPQPKISISDVTITEGDSGIAFAEFQVHFPTPALKLSALTTLPLITLRLLAATTPPPTTP